MATQRQGPKDPPLPVEQAPKGRGEKSVFTAFINSHKALKDYASDIWTWANNYGGITPTQLAAVIWTESKGDPNAKSGVGASGIAQIFDNKADPQNAAGVPFFRGDTTITPEDKLNTAFAIRYAAWRLSGYASTHGGSIDQIWQGGYNPKYKPGVDGPPNPISQYLPKGYVGTATATATATAGRAVDTAAVTATTKTEIFDRWAVLDKSGKVKFTRITDPTNPPANVLKFGPTPLTQSTFLQDWKEKYSDTYFAYTGHQASGKQIASILKNAPSVYTLANVLAKTPAFQTSPTYKAHAPGVIGVAKSMFGDDWKPDKAFVAKAIAQNWDQATLETNLRARPEYESGPQFKDNIAKLSNVYQGIYGNVTPAASKAMTNLARLGWTQDQVAAWLRQMPEYKSSQEYKSRALSFAQQLGLITGQMPTLTADQAMLGGPPQTPTATPTGAPAPVPASVSGTYPKPVPVRPDDRAGVRGV